jgi:hypothetical protein
VKVLVAPDKFKGGLTALEVAERLATGLRTVQAVHTIQLPLADGGDRRRQHGQHLRHQPPPPKDGCNPWPAAATASAKRRSRPS